MGAEMIRKSSKANGSAPLQGEVVFIFKDSRISKDRCVLPPGIVVGIREHDERDGRKEYKVALRTPFGIVLLEEWMEAENLVVCVARSGALLNLDEAIGMYGNNHEGDAQLPEYAYQVIAQGLNPKTKSMRANKGGCSCVPGKGCFLRLGEDGSICPCRRDGIECGSACHKGAVAGCQCLNPHGTYDHLQDEAGAAHPPVTSTDDAFPAGEEGFTDEQLDTLLEEDDLSMLFSVSRT